MQKIGQLIDKIPLQMLVVMTIFLGMAPYIPFLTTETPHLFSKLNMLANGELVKPLDIFDLVMHGAPPTLLTIRLFRKFALKTNA